MLWISRDILISWHDLISLGWYMRFLAGKVRALTEQSNEVYKQFEMKLMCKFAWRRVSDGFVLLVPSWAFHLTRRRILSRTCT